MKTWIKVILIVAAVMAGLGILLTGISLILGGAQYDGPASGSGSERVMAASREENRYEVTESIREISVEWVSGDVLLETWEGDTLVLEETSFQPISEKNRLVYRVEDGELEIEYLDGSRLLGTGKLQSKELKILVPEAMAPGLQEVSVDAVSSDVEVRGLKLRSLDTNTVSGNISCRNVTVEELDVETVSGSFTGDFAICPREMEFESVSGDVTVGLPEDTDFSLDRDGASGDFRCDLPTRPGAPNQMKMSTVSGTLEVHLTEAP